MSAPPSFRGTSLLLGPAGVIFLLVVGHPALAAPPTPKVDYNFHIRPILADRCFTCHGPDEKKRKADLRLDTADGLATVVVGGKPDESELVYRITAKDGGQMPPPKSKLRLSKQEVALLERWVAQGAEYKPHWAFLPLPDRVPLPAVQNIAWSTNPMDRFVLARLEQEGLRPAPAAPREDWIRRVTFDLTGLPPTPAEVDAFLADPSPDAFARVVDRLLASPRYGERLATEWLDVARYADSFGYQADGDMNVWPWRDWVIAAFNRNLSYDQFLTWQLAGDLVPDASREQRLATAFSRLHRMTNEGGSIPEEWRIEYVADRVHTFGTAFLGLTFECSRCHDHKYDPITMKDYYQLGAFFNNIDEWGTYDNSRFCPTPTLPLPTPSQQGELARLTEEVRQKEARLPDLVRSRERAFQTWLKQADHQAEIPGLLGHFPLDRLEGSNKLANVARNKAAGTTSPANKLVAGRTGQALRFTGDDPADFPVPERIEREVPFTVSFWLQTPRTMSQGIIFHRQSGTDTGFHGLELAFEAGRLRFGLIRFWPGDAAVVQTTKPLPGGQWVHVAVSHDGSAQAAGIRLHVDGRPAPVEVLRDSLTKNIEPGGKGFTFGERFRSPGLKDCLLDEVRIHDRVLSDIEVAQLHDGRSLTEALARQDAAVLRPYYFAALDAEVAQARGELRQVRQRLFAAQTGVFEIMTMREMDRPRPAHILARGAYDAPRDRPVGRDTPASLPPYPENTPRDRLGLARWLTGPRHPLTARVAVNRYWQMFFGRGLIGTTENFGTQGGLPTHPLLLDWLAREFIASGWDVKHLCRQIVLSSTYRQRSACDADLRERDPENLLLARGPARRLSAEMLRDATLAVGGLLVNRIGGEPVKPYQPPGLWKGQNNFLPPYVQDKGEGLYRRTMYTFWRRTSPPPNMLALDMPGREVCLVRRQTTSTPLQPLVLLNDPQFVEAARALGERMLRADGTLGQRITLAFRLGATRRPTDQEVALLRDLYLSQKEGFGKEPKTAKQYLAVGDRPPAADLDPVALAAATVVSNAILNLDAALMLR